MQHTFSFFFFFNDTATTEIYTLSLHDALPISSRDPEACWTSKKAEPVATTLKVIEKRSPFPSIPNPQVPPSSDARSEEHTSELQSQSNLVCRLLLEKKKKQIYMIYSHDRLVLY